MNRQKFTLSPETVMGIAAATTLGGALAVVWGGAALAGLHRAPAAGNPVHFVADLVDGRFTWSAWDTYDATLIAALLAVALTVVVVRRSAQSPRHHVDHRARLLARDPVGLRPYVDPAAGPSAELPGRPVIGVDVVGHDVICGKFEDVGITIAGARMRKTTSWVIPSLLGAPGAAYTTSNKRDVWDATHELRAEKGHTWLYDPQRIAGGMATWWWNPLDMADSVAGAMTLAGLFAAASRPVGASMDSFFDPEGEALLAMMLLGAHRGNKPITAVYHWLTDPRDDEPAVLLEQAAHDLAAAGVRGVIGSPDRQRGGVYGTAKKMVSFLVDGELSRWCVDDGTARPRFTARDFASSTDTVYALSKEGPGSAGPLTAAFTAGVMRAAEAVASESERGRLKVPMLAVLDEVANVCRWRELPDLYSHYGSRGIIVWSYLQSWAQGVECWGRDGMAKLWSAANIRVYGGGANEDAFLEAVSKMCGEVDVVSDSISRSQAGQTHSQSFRRERVLDVGTLAAVPIGRAVVMLSGAPPVVVRTQSCLDGPHADVLRERLAGPPATKPVTAAP